SLGDWGSGVQISPLRPIKSNSYEIEAFRRKPITERQRNLRPLLCASPLSSSPQRAPQALTTEPATDCAKAEEAMRRTFNLNWALPATQSLDQDVVRVWSANAPPAHRQPTAREHAAELLQVPESVEQTGRDVGVRRTTAPARAGRSTDALG